MKKSVRLCAFALALVALCGGLLTHRFDASAQCVETHRRAKTDAPGSDVPRALPTLPGMRLFTRAGML